MIRVPTCVLALLLIAMPARAAASPDVERVVHAFYSAYAAGDTTAAAAFWTPADAKTFVTRNARMLRIRCQVLQGVVLESVEVDGEVATANVEARLTRWNAMPGAAIETDVQRSVMVLRRERGAWKIGEWRMREEDLGRRLLELPTPEERETLLRNAGVLRNARMVRILCREAVTKFNQENRAWVTELMAQAKEIAAELDDPAAFSDVLGVESILLRGTDLAAGTAAARRAVAMAGESGDPDALARALMRLARTQAAARNSDEAASSFHRVLALGKFIEDASVLALSASQLARIHDAAQEPRDALRSALIASAYAAETGDPASIISTEMNLAGTYGARGDREMAIPHAEIAVAAAERAGFVSVHADALHMLARYHYLMGSRDRYLELSSKALELHEEGGGSNPRADVLESRVEILVTRADFRMEVKDYAGAEEELKRASTLLDTMRQKTEQHQNFGRAMGELRARQGRYDEAMQYAEPLDRAHSHLLAFVLEGQGRSEEARQAWEAAIQVTEKYRTSLDHTQHRSLFLGISKRPYVKLIANLVEGGKPREALAVAERLKARVLKELLAGRPGTPETNDQELLRLNAQIVELNRRLLEIQGDGGDPALVRSQLRRARGQLEEAMARADVMKPPALEASSPPALDLAALPPGMTVVELVVGKEQTTVFLIRRLNGGVDVRTTVVDIAEPELQSLARRFTRAVEQRDAKYATHARRLYDLLLQPVLGADPSPGTLCVIPDDQLWLVPFQALITPRGDHLIERGPIFYAPSLSTMLAAGGRTPGSDPPTLLAIGDPKIDDDTAGEIYAVHRDATLGRLPDAEREVRELQRFYGKRASVHLGPLASESLVKREAGQYDIVHFATHGIVDDAPEYSALLLAGSKNEDGLLEAREIQWLPLQADLVVLSACNTAGRSVRAGEGVIGLSWAILATGVPRTVATQWRVGSASAARLMIDFHKRLAAQKRVTNVARCLRDAQMGMLRSRTYAHPYYWAGFVLVGRDD